MEDDIRRENKARLKRNSQSKRCCGTSRYYCNKICLLIFSVFYLVVGLGLFGLGVWVEIDRQHYKEINNHLALPVALLIFVGLFILLSALCGVIGSVKENPTLLKLFLCITIVSLMVQVTVGVIAFIYRQQIPSIVSSQLMFVIREYSDNTNLRAAMDYLQSKYKCCGLDSLQDYEENVFFSCVTSDKFNGTCGVPSSCCDTSGTPESSCGYGMRIPGRIRESKIYTDGCMSAFIKWLSDNIDLVGATALGFAVPQVLGIVLSYYLIRGAEDRMHWYTVSDYVKE